MDNIHVPRKHWTTPQKARILDINKFISLNSLRSPNGTNITKQRLFQQHNVPLTSAKRITKQRDPRRLNNSKIRKDTRGRKSKLSKQDIRSLKRLI